MERLRGGYTLWNAHRRRAGKADSTGYTIIEVLIVTAISTLLIISAFTVFSGKQRETQFSQAMQDVNSKIQNYVAQVRSGNFPGSEAYSCQVSGSPARPSLTATSSSVGTNDACIFLGRAIQAVRGTGNIYAYTVLGNRDKYDASGIDTGEAATTLISEINPDPAIVSGNFVLSDTYKVPYGATLRSVTTSGSATEYSLVGFYTDLNSTSAGTLTLRGYPFTSDAGNPTANVQDCIRQSPTCTAASEINQWNLCFSDSDSQRQALLSVNSGPSGITTQLSFKDCS